MALALELVKTLRHLAGHRLDAQVAAHTRLHVADTVGVSLAARRDETLYRALRQAMGEDGSGGAAVFGGPHRLPASHAAFVNAALAHALDFDDIHDLARLHPTPVTLAAALACGGASADDVDGARWLTGVALGNELMCRLGRACAPQGSGAASNWFLTQLFGGLGAAVSAGWAMGLDDVQLEAAIGFACMQASGHKEPGFGIGSNARQLYPAFAAMAGVTAARLAAAGLSAPSGSLDGAAGLLPVYLRQEVDATLRQMLLDRTRWHALDTAIKPWPCCRLSHPYVAAALDLRRRLGAHGVSGIRKLVIGVNASAAKLCTPLSGRIRPATLADAKYSIPFMTAWTLVHGEPTLDQLVTSAIDDPAVLALASTIEIQDGQPDRPGHPLAQLQAWLSGVPGGVAAQSDGVPDLDELAVSRKFESAIRHAGHPDGAALWEQLRGQNLSVSQLMSLCELPDR